MAASAATSLGGQTEAGTIVRVVMTDAATQFITPLTMQTLGELSYADIGKQLSTLADAYDVKLPRELVLIGKQFLYVERYMNLLAPKWQMMSDPQLTGYFANFMVEVAREHNESDIEV